MDTESKTQMILHFKNGTKACLDDEQAALISKQWLKKEDGNWIYITSGENILFAFQITEVTHITTQNR